MGCCSSKKAYEATPHEARGDSPTLHAEYDADDVTENVLAEEKEALIEKKPALIGGAYTQCSNSGELMDLVKAHSDNHEDKIDTKTPIISIVFYTQHLHTYELALAIVEGVKTCEEDMNVRLLQGKWMHVLPSHLSLLLLTVRSVRPLCFDMSTYTSACFPSWCACSSRNPPVRCPGLHELAS